MQNRPNQTLETNCRPASPLDAGWQFGRAVHARPCVSGGSRSAHLGVTTKTSNPERLRGTTRLLFGLLVALFLFPVSVEIMVRGFEAWKFIVAATGFSLFFLFSAATGRPFWPKSK